MKNKNKIIKLSLFFLGTILLAMYVYHNYQVMYKACSKDEANPALVKEYSFESNYRYNKCESVNITLNKQITEAELRNLRKEIDMIDGVYSIDYFSSADVGKRVSQLEQTSAPVLSSTFPPQLHIYSRNDENKNLIISLTQSKQYVDSVNPGKYISIKCTLLTCNNIYRTITTFYILPLAELQKYF